MENEKELNVDEQNKMVEDETPTIFAPNYSDEVKVVEPVEPIELPKEVAPSDAVDVKPFEEITPDYINEVKSVETVEPIDVIPSDATEVKVEEVTPVEPVVTPDYSNEVKSVEPVEPVEETEMTEEEKAELRERLSKEEVLENPSAKVVLNRETVREEVKQAVEETVTKNESLRFIIILGAILLAVVIVMPYISKLFQL